VKCARSVVRRLFPWTAFALAWAWLPAAWADGPSVLPRAAAPPAASASSVPPSASVTPTTVSSPLEPAPLPLGDVLTGEAKSDYEAGRALFGKQEYAGALEKFESAARASRDPRLWWNAAACEAAMTHYASAGRLMKRYLDSRSPVISPNAAQEARDFLDETEHRTANLDVTSNEPDAIVFIDDEPIAAAAWPSGFRVDPGTRHVRVTKRGFSDYALTLVVASTADVRVDAVLRPSANTGRLVVRAGARDAIAIDGTLVGVQSWSGPLAAGPHRIRLTGPDSVPFESNVTVEDDQTRSVDVTLPPARHAAGLPAWLWIAGSTALAAGAIAAGYFLFKTDESPAGSPIDGSLGTARAPLR
jgi:hypothetical protein